MNTQLVIPNDISGNAERGSISPGECKVTSMLRLWAIRIFFFVMTGFAIITFLFFIFFCLPCEMRYILRQEFFHSRRDEAEEQEDYCCVLFLSL